MNRLTLKCAEQRCHAVPSGAQLGLAVEPADVRHFFGGRSELSYTDFARTLGAVPLSTPEYPSQRTACRSRTPTSHARTLGLRPSRTVPRVTLARTPSVP